MDGEDQFGFVNIDPRAIDFDPASGLLSLTKTPGTFAAEGLTPLLKVDLSAEDPLREAGLRGPVGIAIGKFTLGNVVVVTSPLVVKTYDVADLTKPLDTAYLKNYVSLEGQSIAVSAGQTFVWDIAGQWGGEPFTIQQVEAAAPLTATLNADQTITITVVEDATNGIFPIRMTVQFESGAVQTFNPTVSVYVPEAKFSDIGARLEAKFIDDAGNVVTNPSAGDEVWVTVSAIEDQTFASGIYAAYVDVSFNSSNIEVVGQPQNLGAFTNGTIGQLVTSTGIESLGGFGGMTPSGSAQADFARFKIRILDDGPVTMTISPSRKLGNELLIHGQSRAVDPDKIPAFVLSDQMTIRTFSTESESRQDVNSDGVVTALDVLAIVNFINERNSASAESVSLLSAGPEQPSNLDVTGDGVISGLDVLQIVNTINARYSAPASGEGSALRAQAVDSVYAADLFDTFADLKKNR